MSDRVNQTSVYLSSDMRLNELLQEYNDSTSLPARLLPIMQDSRILWTATSIWNCPWSCRIF